MKTVANRWRQMAFAVATAAALAFGASQAVATTPAVSDDERAACSRICAPECGTFGGTYVAGICRCCG